MKRVIPQTLPGTDTARLFERPDGFYWQEPDGSREHGPFETLLEAALDMQAMNEETPEPGETLQEAQAEIGMADWIDPDTGEPAEDLVSHLEEH